MDNLKRFADITRKIKALEVEREDLKASVMDEIQSSGTNSINNIIGTFTIIERRSYEYPPEIIGLETNLKEQKKDYEHSEAAILKNVLAYPMFRELEASNK